MAAGSWTMKKGLQRLEEAPPRDSSTSFPAESGMQCRFISRAQAPKKPVTAKARSGRSSCMERKRSISTAPSPVLRRTFRRQRQSQSAHSQ